MIVVGGSSGAPRYNRYFDQRDAGGATPFVASLQHRRRLSFNCSHSVVRTHIGDVPISQNLVTVQLRT